MLDIQVQIKAHKLLQTAHGLCLFVAPSLIAKCHKNATPPSLPLPIFSFAVLCVFDWVLWHPQKSLSVYIF